jgi:hypothetical protein
MMRVSPNLTKFGYQGDEVRTMRRAAASSVFGGTVFSGIGAVPRKPNSLETDIKQLDRTLDVM